MTGEYVFDAPGGPVDFPGLFATGKDTLYLYNFMYVPGERGLPLETACPSCTAILDGMDGAFRHLLDRVDVAIVAKAPIAEFAAWGEERGWRFAPLYSSSPNSFNRDYNAEADDGSQLPIAHVFTRSDGAVHHRWSSELQSAPRASGQEPRHVDFMWPVWKVLDLTPDGRGSDWHLAYDYGA